MVKIYSSETCAPCKTLKTFLSNKSIDYTVLDIGNDKHLTDLIELTGNRIVPTSVIGESIIIGLNLSRVLQALST